MTTYRCHSCGCEDLPPNWRKVIAEFEALSERERRAVRHLLSGIYLYGWPSKSPDWANEIADCLRELLPSYSDASKVGDGIERILSDWGDHDDELPPAWKAERE